MLPVAAPSALFHFAVLTVAVCQVACVRAGFDATPSDVPTRSDAANRDTIAIASDGFLSSDGAVRDAGIMPDQGPTVPDQGPTVGPLTPFNPPMREGELSMDEYEDDPSLPADMLEILFECDGDICRATREAPTEPWSAPAVVKALSSKSDDTTPEFHPDGLIVYVASDRNHASALVY